MWGRPNIPSEKGHRGICLLGNIVSVFVPGKVVADGHTQVFGIGLHGKLLTTDVVVSTDMPSLVSDAKNTLVGIEGHLPLRSQNWRLSRSSCSWIQSSLCWTFLYNKLSSAKSLMFDLIQSNFNGSNTDGSFTTAVSNSFSSP